MMNANFMRHLILLLAIGGFASAQDGATLGAAEGETVHVLVGKSVVINVQAPLTRIVSSNSTAVEALARECPATSSTYRRRPGAWSSGYRRSP